jgi:hypothetical protein
MDKRITLTPQAAKDIRIVAALAGTNTKNYIETLVNQHLTDLGYPKKKR